MKSNFNDTSNNDQLSSKQAMLSFLVPPVGIVNYLYKKKTSPNSAKASGKIALFSLALTGAGLLSRTFFGKKSNLSGVSDKHSASWISTFITIPDLKIKVKVPFGPKCIEKVFVEFKGNKIIVTDENGSLINF